MLRGILAFIIAFIIIMISNEAWPKDPDGRYANSPLKPWFDLLHSKKGYCCSDADGTALSDVDWLAPGQADNDTSHYKVRIEGQWWIVPDDAVITEPNRVGKTMVWPVYKRTGDHIDYLDIRCFMPGPMT